MRHNLGHRTDLDYEVYLLRIQAGTFEAALSGSGLAVPPRTADFARAPATAPASTDYFAFYQENGRWAWRRVAASGAVVAVSSYTFRYYLECTADAKQHGWRGTPLYPLVASGLPERDGDNPPRLERLRTDLML